MDIRVSTLSESAISVFIGKEISVENHHLLFHAQKYINENPFDGLKEVVLAYHSITIFYDPLIVFHHVKSSPNEFLKKYIAGLPWANFVKNVNFAEQKIIEIPVKYGGADLEVLSDILKLSTKEIVGLHSEKIYQVFMIGFLPGFPYLGVLNEKLRIKRKDTPSPKIEKGSVAIANLQTGIYPTDSPGGWYVLGKTKIEMYNWERTQRSFLKAGDQVIFKSI